MNITKYEDFLEDVKKLNFKHVGLFNSNGDKIIPFNSNKVPLQKRLDEIQARLESSTIPDGMYIVKAKTYISNATVPTEYCIQKDTGQPPEITTTMNENGQNSGIGPQMLSYKEALDMQVENNTLKFQLEQQELKMAELLQRMDSIQQEHEALQLTNEALEVEQQTLEDEPQGTSTGEWIAKMVEYATPILEEHFELQHRKLELDEAKWMMHSANQIKNGQTMPELNPNFNSAGPQQMPQQTAPGYQQQYQQQYQPQQQFQQPQQPMSTEAAIGIKIMEMAETNPELYQQIMPMIMNPQAQQAPPDGQ